MIAKNNVITEKEIVEFYKNKVFDTSKNMSLFYKLNQEYVDHLNNGSHLIKNPLTLRDDVNFTNDKISEIISTLNRNKNITFVAQKNFLIKILISVILHKRVEKYIK